MNNFRKNIKVKFSINFCSDCHAERSRSVKKKSIILNSVFLIVFFPSVLISQTSIDNLTYHYNANTNQLNYVKDLVPASSFDDLDDQSTGNYTYNANGQLISDAAEGILKIEWTVTGKVNEVTYADRTIKFKYDAMGNRVKKIETDLTTHNPQLTTYYIRNAMGELISVYEDKGSGLNRIEVEISDGSDNFFSTSPVSTTEFERSVGSKNYALNDHLNNVRVVVSDVKEPKTGLTTYNSQLTTNTDYYSFGMLMPGRTLSLIEWRNGFQNFEKDDELKGNSNSYTTFYRLYDPRVGRWNSMDPKINYESPYTAFANNPIVNIDPLGDTTMIFTLKSGNVADYSKTVGLNEVGVSIMVMNEMDGSVRGYSLNDERDAGDRKTPNDISMPSIEKLYIFGEDIVEENLKGVPDGETLSEYEKWDFTYHQSMAGGKIDFGTMIGDNEMAIVDGQAYNSFDFGNFIWGAAIKKLGWSYDMAWAGSNYNAWYNEKIQNGFEIEGWSQNDTKNMFNPNRLTWRREDCFLCFDEKYDQSAIYEGHHWFDDKKTTETK